MGGEGKDLLHKNSGLTLVSPGPNRAPQAAIWGGPGGGDPRPRLDEAARGALRSHPACIHWTPGLRPVLRLRTERKSWRKSSRTAPLLLTP